MKVYQEGRPSFLGSHQIAIAKTRTFFWCSLAHYTKPSKPTPSLIDSTPPAPQRSFPQSQAEVPRGSQDREPSRPNDLTPSLQRGFPSPAPLVLCSLCVCARAAAAQRLNGPAPGNHVAT